MSRRERAPPNVHAPLIPHSFALLMLLSGFSSVYLFDSGLSVGLWTSSLVVYLTADELKL